MNTEKKLGRYQQKVRMGLVPTYYDRNSKSFLAGAHKHWTGNFAHDHRQALEDARFLQMAREMR